VSGLEARTKKSCIRLLQCPDRLWNPSNLLFSWHRAHISWG